MHPTDSSRRRALVVIGAAAPTLALGARAARAASAVSTNVARGAPAAAPPAPSDDSLRAAAAEAEISELMGEIRPGTSLARCRVISAAKHASGAVAVVMTTPAGRRFQLDVLRDDGSLRGQVGRAPGLAVYVSNGGDGATPTDEEQGLAAMALGRALAKRIAEGARVPALHTLGERAERFPGGSFRA